MNRWISKVEVSKVTFLAEARNHLLWIEDEGENEEQYVTLILPLLGQVDQIQ